MAAHECADRDAIKRTSKDDGAEQGIDSMNYYERHLGDYAKDAGHLSMLEHGAYTLLLDRYYTTEKGIPVDQAYRVARAITKPEKAAVDAVLAEFFVCVDGIWIKNKVEEVISDAQARIDAARTNGKTGGRPRKKPRANPIETQEKPTGLILGSVNETQKKALQSPISIHQEENTDTSPSPTVLVFEHWQKTHGHPKAKLDPKRRKIITLALREFSPEELCRAIDGYKKSAWHQGKNERKEVFDDIELMLRDAKHVENGHKFLTGGGVTEWVL